METLYDWSNVEHLKKKMNYIRNTIILGNLPYDQLPEIQRKDFDEYVNEFFNIKNNFSNFNYEQAQEVIDTYGISIYDMYYILKEPANAASESLDNEIHPMIKEFFSRLEKYSQELEESYARALIKETKPTNRNKRGFAVTIIILIATILFGFGLGALLFFIK